MDLEYDNGLGFWGGLFAAGAALINKSKSSPSAPPAPQPVPVVAPRSRQPSRLLKLYGADTRRQQIIVGKRLDRMNRIIADERTRRSATRGLLPLAIAGGVVLIAGGLLLRGRR